jgi:hypothetical protein
VVALHQCEYQARGRRRCKAHARTGDRFCFFHSPLTARERRGFPIEGDARQM